MIEASDFARELLAAYSLVDRRVALKLPGFSIGLRSNSAPLVRSLEGYFGWTLGTYPVDVEVVMLETEAAATEAGFVDWQREPGKSGRKDEYKELGGGRLVRKVRTGMTFLQSEAHRIAFGPCLRYENQVINFINSQYMNWLQIHDALICHAAALVYESKCLAIAGLSGGGKSTLMLHMLATPKAQFLTNDRLFLRREGAALLALGIPKLPRVNPGTLLHNPILASTLSAKRRAELLAMPASSLWDLEDKADVDIAAVFGASKMAPPQPLSGVLVLNWSRSKGQPCVIRQAEISERPELLAAIMKSPGPFYQKADGSFLSDDLPLDPAPYQHMLTDIALLEATGSIDFDTAARHCLAWLRG